jgi:hypothetical protein
MEMSSRIGPNQRIPGILFSTTTYQDTGNMLKKPRMEHLGQTAFVSYPGDLMCLQDYLRDYVLPET